MQLLRELMPAAKRFAVLLNPTDPEGYQSLRDIEAAAGGQGILVLFDTRWATGNADLYRTYATELVALAPDVILATASPTVGALQMATRTVPIVFAQAVDPVGGGFVDSLARPGGNLPGSPCSSTA